MRLLGKSLPIAQRVTFVVTYFPHTVIPASFVGAAVWGIFYAVTYVGKIIPVKILFFPMTILFIPVTVFPKPGIVRSFSKPVSCSSETLFLRSVAVSSKFCIASFNSSVVPCLSGQM